MISQETWQAIRPTFVERYPCEAVVAVWEDGSWQEFANVHPLPERAFRIGPEDSAKLLMRPPHVLIHSHCSRGVVEHLDWPSDPDSAQQIASGWTWGIVAVAGSVEGDILSVKYPVFWGDAVPRQPLLGRSYHWVLSDCFTLMRDYHRSVGIHYRDVPRVRDPNVTDAEGNLYYPRDHWAHRYYPHWIKELGFVPVDHADRKPGDACFRRGDDSGHLDHCAVYLGEGKYLEITEKRTSYENIPEDEEKFWMETRARFYRWKGRK